MRQSIKIRLHLERDQQAILDSQSKILNWAYNHLLEKARNLRSEYAGTGDKDIAKNLYSKYGLRNMLPDLKKEHSFLCSVHSSPLKNAALRLSEAITVHQKSKRGERRGKLVNWPKFRSQKRKWFSLLYDEPGKGFKLTGCDLRLSCGTDKDGKRIYINARLAAPLSQFGKMRLCQLRILKSLSGYYAVLVVEKVEKPLKPVKRLISIDPNHKNLGYGVDNGGSAIEIANAYFLKSLDQRIDELKAKRDRCKRKSRLVTLASGRKVFLPSRRWRFFDAKLERLYEKRREQTKSYLFSIANRLFREYDLVAIGDYTPQGGGITRKMRRSMNNQSLIARFKEVLAWVAKRGGKQFVIWGERGSTRTCNRCGEQVAEGLSPEIRSWECVFCGQAHIRDENAAINGLLRTLEKHELPRLGHRFFSAKDRCTWRFNGLGVSRLAYCGVC